jgi:hypothetical protein
MIRNGIPTDHVETYLHRQPWVADAARLLGPKLDFTDELVDTMIPSGALTVTDARLHAAAEHAGSHTIAAMAASTSSWLL